MPVGYRSAASSGNEFSSSSRSATVPAGAVAGDVMIAFLERWGADPAITPPSGFADWGTTYSSGDAASNIHVFWKRLTGSDAGSYSFSWSGALWSHLHVVCLTGVIASGTPIEATNGWAGTAGSYGSTSVTTATIPGLVWKCYNDTGGSHTSPTGYTEVIDNDCGSVAYLIGSATGSQTAAGGSVTSSSPATAVLVAVKPIAGGGGPTPAATALETDAALTLNALKRKTAGFPAETDTAIQIARSKRTVASQTAETDSALPFTRSKRKTATVALQSDTALPLGRLRSRSTGTAPEVEQALPIGKVKRRSLNLASETDAALVISSTSGISQPINAATSIEAALPIGRRRSRALGTVVEIDLAREISFLSPAWRLRMPTIRERWSLKGSLSTSTYREVTVFGDETGLYTTEQGSRSPGSDAYGAIPFGTKYIWYGGHVNITDDPAVKTLWLAHGFEVENVTL